MQLVAALAGIFVVLTVVVDAFWTVLWSGMGAGPLTAQVTGVVRRGRLLLDPGNRRWMSITGPLALLAIVTLWALLLLVGFSLVTQAMPEGIRSQPTGRPADAWERVYYVGYTLFTLGIGDFVPHGDGARMLTVAMNAMGMFLISLGVTYLLPVISASVQSRTFASSTLALGGTPVDVVLNSWDGQRIELDHQLETLSAQLGLLAHQHLAYPVLHLFHTADVSTSAPRAVALVDDVLDLLDATDGSVTPPGPPRRQLRAAIARYLETFGPHVTDAPDAPPPPPLHPLREAGIPLACDEQGFRVLLHARAEHRRRIRSLLETDDVEPPTETGLGDASRPA